MTELEGDRWITKLTNVIIQCLFNYEFNNHINSDKRMHYSLFLLTVKTKGEYTMYNASKLALSRLTCKKEEENDGTYRSLFSPIVKVQMTIYGPIKWS